MVVEHREGMASGLTDGHKYSDSNTKELIIYGQKFYSPLDSADGVQNESTVRTFLLIVRVGISEATYIHKYVQYVIQL